MNSIKLSIFRPFLIIVTISFLLTGCGINQKNSPPLIIAISKGIPLKSYSNYYEWLKKTDSTIVISEMYHLSLDSALAMIEECDGLLLTGGTDVHPGKYGKAYDTVRCWPIDFKRDSLEFSLITKALALNMPIFGICRGEQILNVARGGSLYVDLPQDLGEMITHRCEDPSSCYHDIYIDKGSILEKISNLSQGNVNSNHHQGIEILGDRLKAIAFTDDGLTEAIQWADPDPEKNAFLLGVQWHPERMNYDNPLSGPLAERFLREARRYSDTGEQ